MTLNVFKKTRYITSQNFVSIFGKQKVKWGETAESSPIKSGQDLCRHLACTSKILHVI